MKIGSVSLANSPAIAVTVTDREPVVLLRRAKQLGAHLFEARIDRFRRLDEKNVLKRLRLLRKTGLPLIATVRSRPEGGGRSLSEAKRLQLFQSALPFVDALDIELSSGELRKNLVPAARRQKKGVILSYHNFKETPSDGVLRSILSRARQNGADWVKLAVTPKRDADVSRFLKFSHRHRNHPLITIVMGPRGTLSRVLAPFFGSRLTYSFLGKSQAPGQLSLPHLVQKMKDHGLSIQ